MRGDMSGNGTVYLVEGRYNFPEPKDFGGQIFDKEWRVVNTVPSEIGVRNEVYHDDLQQNGYLTFKAAKAIAAWFETLHYCLETRLVQVKYSMSWKFEEIGVCCQTDCNASKKIEVTPKAAETQKGEETS